MKWLDERPRPLHEAWNILCDAVEERKNALQIQWSDSLEIPRQKPAISKRNFNIANMREIIFRLLGYSFLPSWFGIWWNCKACESPNRGDSFYKDFQIDESSFLHVSTTDGPQYKHTVNDFIHASAKLINNLILYPLPEVEAKYRGNQYYGNKERAGFLLDANLEIELWDSEEYYYTPFWKGLYSTDGEKTISTQTDIGEVGITAHPYDIVVYSPYYAHARATNVKFKYCKKGEIVTHRRMYYLKHACPSLIGMGKIKFSGDGFHYYDGSTLKTIEFSKREYDINLNTGYAIENVDINPVKNIVDEMWEDYGSFYVKDDNYVRIPENIEIYLTKDNFPELNYKYIC